MKEIVIGTRPSQLAGAQAQLVADQLSERRPDYDFKLKEISTKGDRILDQDLKDISGKGLFIKEIEVALLNQEIDLAVHSCKDLPSDLPPRLEIVAVPRRANPYDVVVTKEDLTLNQLPEGARLGTGSLRRKSQLLHYRSDLEIEPIRGNVETRLKKLEKQPLDGLVLAAAGLERLGRSDAITQYLNPSICVPAARQGALAVEGRSGDKEIKKLAAEINHQPTETIITAEHAFLARLQGGCKVPVGSYAWVNEDELEIVGIVGKLDGSKVLRETVSGPSEQAESLGIKLADKLIEQGAEKILVKIKKEQK